MRSFSFLLTGILFFLLINKSYSGDIYAEYKMTGTANKNITTKLYMKNGNVRSEANMDMGGKKMTTVTLKLKSKPGVSIFYNTMSKVYNEVKRAEPSSKSNDVTVNVIGSEKVGAYNCKHVKITSKDKSWDMWLTKDLPQADFPMENDEVANQKMKSSLKAKGVDGVLVKMAFMKPGTTMPMMTMQLLKYEQKTLAQSLFEIPQGYTKSTVDFDPQKMKSMSPEEKQKMIKQMMEQQGKGMPH